MLVRLGCHREVLPLRARPDGHHDPGKVGARLPLAARASRSNAPRPPRRTPFTGAFAARGGATVALALAAALRAPPCAAEPAAGELRHDLRVDIPVTAGAAGV
ncbi:MAG TPA: hypothetical protein PLR99_13460, partial [Polyangiaceae bacterium]|nr:hypothetical protein [Polyangiaceae bacterium]